jgi:sigma-B regulation protein RsbU (phosphoserine phosphatase)
VNFSRLSIRYKILLILTVIPAAALLVYLAIALRVFREDKVAYVFDTTSQMSSSIAGQLKTRLDNIVKLTQPILLDLGQYQDFSRLSRAFLQFDSALQSMTIMVWNEKTANYQVGPVLEKDNYIFEKFWTQWKNQWNPNLIQLFMNQTVVTNPFLDDRFVLVQKIDRPNERPYLVVLLFQLSDLAQQFQTKSAQDFYLVQKDGKVLLGPETYLGANLKDSLPVKFLSLNKQAGGSGVETATDTHKVQRLVSYASVGWGDLYVVSTVPEDKALGAVEILKRKSFIFLMILIAATTILSLLASSAVTHALTQLFEATGEVSKGHFNVNVSVDSNDEVGALAQNFNKMAAEVSRLLEQTAEKARMESELQTARMVQETLFPAPRADFGSMEVAGFYEPASEVGGDWWNYTRIGDQVYLWIGDATGHGAGAALITSAAKSAAGLIETLGFSPAQALEALNRSISDVSRGKVMMTFFLGKLNLKTLKLDYCNASHEAPFLFRRKEGPYKKKDIEFLNEVNNPRLGQSRDSAYKETSVQLGKGDLLFFYTDGVPDIRNPKNEPWGEREFIKGLLASLNTSPSCVEALTHFCETFQVYRQGTTLADDLTFFIVKNKEEQTQEVSSHEQVSVQS